MDWANLVIAIAALGIAGDAHIRGRLAASRGAADAAAAHQASLDAAKAAQDSAAALERMADQWAESLARSERRDQRQWSRPGRGDPPGLQRRDSGPWAGLPPSGPGEQVVHWAVSKVKGRQHTLTNLGQATAYGVVLTSENAARFDGPTEPRDIAMGESVTFLAIGSMQTGTPELLVTWADDAGAERRRWRRPLP